MLFTLFNEANCISELLTHVLFCVFADVKLTEGDAVNFKSNKDSFLQMTSVKAITERCAQRGVLSDERGKEIIMQGGHRKTTGTFWFSKIG